MLLYIYEDMKDTPLVLLNNKDGFNEEFDGLLEKWKQIDLNYCKGLGEYVSISAFLKANNVTILESTERIL